MKLLRLAFAACLAALLAGGIALAQGSGGLVVKVIDGDGLPLPGAQVTIEHEAGNVKPYTTLSDGRGQATFPVLRPGQGYIVTVSMPSFGARREENIRVPIGDSVTVAIQLAEEIVERVRVVATEDVVELADTSSTAKFSDEFVQDLPVPGRFYQNVLTLAPGVNDPDGDGNPTVHGSRSRDFRAQVSGVSNVDPLTGQQMSFVNSDSIEEIEVVSSGAGVEFGRAQGGFANIVQKQGTNQFEGTFGFLYRTSKLDGTGALNRNNTVTPDFGEIHPSLLLSGPIIKDKLWYRLAHELVDRQDPINTVGTIVTQDTVRGIHSDALTWQVSPRNKLMFQLASDPLTVSNLGVNSTTPAESTLSQDTESQTVQVTWTAPFSPKLLIESTLAYQDLTSKFVPTTSGQPNTCVPDSPSFSMALCTNLDSGETSGSSFITQEASSQRMTLNSRATLYAGRFWGANHQFKFGLAVENERYSRFQDRRPSILTFVSTPTSDADSDRDPEELTIVLATVAAPSMSNINATGTNWGVYLEDQVKPSNNFVITWGLRVDREELNAAGVASFDPVAEQEAFQGYLAMVGVQLDDPYRPSTDIAGAEDPFTRFDYDDFLTEVARNLPDLAGGETALKGTLANIQRQAAFWNNARGVNDFKVANTNVSPFLSLSWDPWSTGKNKFAASARRYYDKIILAIPVIETNSPTTTLELESRQLDDGTLSDPVLRNNINPVASIEVVDRNLKTPYQDEWRFMYEREIFTETLMRVEYINRKYRDQLQNRDINHLASDYGRCGLQRSLTDPTLVASPGTGPVRDPFTNELYEDTDPGPGDGLLDDCIGDVETQRVPDPNAPNGATDIQLARPDGFADLYVTNPAFGTVQLIGNFNEADYEAFVFELIRRQYRSWELQGSYTWSRAVGNGEDFSQDNIGLDPSLLDDEVGYQSNDQRHVVKMSATSITPWGFRIGGSLSWASGLPYSRVRQSLSRDALPPFHRLGQFQPARVRIQYPSQVRNDARNDSQWLFNVKLTKELNLGRGLNMQLSAEIFNLLNDGTYQVYNPDTESGVQLNGRDQARNEFGRRWQLGMRLSF